MRYKREQSKDGEPSIHLQIIQHPSIGSYNSPDGDSFFEPQTQTPSDRTPSQSRNRDGDQEDAPEKKLTLFALRIAVLERIASRLGQLGFIWATVVLLGGLASTLRNKDFWFVTGILLSEGARIFGRSHELEWQHQATWSLTSSGMYSFRKIASSSRHLIQKMTAMSKPISEVKSKGPQIADDIRNLQDPLRLILGYPGRRTWHASDVRLLPLPGWFFISKNISFVLHCLQIISAVVCMTLSLMRLIENNYGEADPRSAVMMFYGVALIEALMFLLENAYWEWTITVNELLEKVNKELDLGKSGLVAIRRFFYDAYSSCINGSIFDGTRMDLVSFAEQLLVSDSQNEQLMGAWILNKFVTNKRFSKETLRKIGSSTGVIERLIDMLNWKNPSEEQIRESAAEIVSMLAGKKQNALRVASIPGAMESISSLLNTGRGTNAKPYEVHDKLVADEGNYDYAAFNLLGLLILKRLAQDHENCYKIGNARGLLAKIIDFTCAGENLLRNDYVAQSQIKLVQRSLKLLKKLVSTTGHTGQMLRQEISDIVFTVSNVRDILEYGENHMMLQKLGIDVLTGLAMDEGAKEKIGRTGKIIKQLLCIFFTPGLTDHQNAVRVEAGEALAMLALESVSNCDRILKENNVVERLTDALKESVTRINASRLLRNVCAYSETENFHSLKGVTAAMPTVLESIMTSEKKPLEVSLGLAIQIFKFSAPEEHEDQLQKAGTTNILLAKKIVETLTEYKHPDIKVPRIRRYAILLATWMMKSHPSYIAIFKELNMEDAITCVAETTTELECFNIFSGSVGLGRTKLYFDSIVHGALELLAQA